MNERINELAEHALQLVADEYTKGDVSRLNKDSYQIKDFIQEKFAELIVKECAEIILLTASTPNDACEVSSIVKQHFGIKE